MGAEQAITFGFDGTLADRVAETSVLPPRMTVMRNVTLGRQLGVPMKCPAAGALGSETAQKAGALVRSEVSGRESTVYLGDPGAGQFELQAYSVSPVRVRSRLVSGTRAQNGYWPVDITDSGVAFPRYAFGAAVCDDWTATLYYDTTAGTVDLYVSLRGGAPVLLQAGCHFTGLGLTRHGDVYRVWYGRSGAIRSYLIYDFDGEVATSSEDTIYTPLNTTTAAYASFGSDGNGDATYAWVLVQDAATATTLRLLKVNVNTATVTSSLAYTTELTSGTTFYLACSQLRIGSTDYVSVAWSDSSAATVRHAVANGTTMASSIAASTLTSSYWPVATQWMSCAGWVGTVTAFSDTDGAVGSAQVNTRFHFRNGPTHASPGTEGGQRNCFWHRLHSQGVMWRRSAGNILPLFALQRHFDDSVTASDDAYNDEPSYELFAPQFYHVNNLEWVVTPIARFGVDKCVHTGDTVAPWAYCTPDGELKVVYPADPENLQETVGTHARYVTLDLTSGGRSTQDERGVGLIAAAGPAYWDGHEVVEWGPYHKPKVAASATGGSGNNLTGTYAFRAVIRWFDASGQEHRSAPSLPVTITPAGTPVQVWVTIPETMRSGVTQQEFNIELYASENGGTYRLVSATLFGLAPTNKSSAGCWLFGNIPTPSSLTKALYSTGTAAQELLPVAPPPLWDFAIVGPRGWGIDAEDRTRAVCTKLKQEGIFYEFADGLEVRFQAGCKLMRISEIDGVPLFLTDKGAFLVHGDGPDNTGGGRDFGLPQRISDVSCTQRHSVVRTPAGVMWANDWRFALMQPGGAVRTFDEIAVPTDIVSAELYEETNEAVFWTSAGSAYVYNYALDRWVTWLSLFGSVGNARTAGKYVVAYDATDAQFFRVGVLSAHATSQAKWTTGWIAPAGPQGNAMFREFLILCSYAGAHGVTVTLYTDYSGDAAHTTTRTWSAAEVLGLVEGTYYTLRVAVSGCPTARAFKLDVQETNATGDGCVPLSCTVLANIDPGVQRRYLAAANK